MLKHFQEGDDILYDMEMEQLNDAAQDFIASLAPGQQDSFAKFHEKLMDLLTRLSP